MLRAGALGDFLLGLPALAALRQRFPGAYLHLAGPLPQACLAAGAANEISSVDAPALAPLFDEGAAPDRLPPWLAGIDIGIVWLRHPQAVAGHLTALGARRLVARPPFPKQEVHVHVAEWLAGTLAELDVALPEDWDARRWVAVPPDERSWAAEASGPSPLVIVHPGSGSTRKNWPAWGAAAAAIGRRVPCRLLVVKGPADDEPVARFLADYRRAGGQGTPAVARSLGLPRLAALLERAALFLGNDSGVTHLAAAVGAPVVSAFGPTNPLIWRPRGPAVSVLGGVVRAPALLPPGNAPACWPSLDDVVGAALKALTPRGRPDRRTPSA